MPPNRFQIVLDTPDVEERVHVVELAPSFQLLVLDRVHYSVLLGIPPPFRIVSA